MKGAWLAASADGVLVNAVIGEKKPGDYIDEAIVLAHERLTGGGLLPPGRAHDVHPAVGHALRRAQGGGVPRAGAQEPGLHPPHVWPGPRRGGQLL